MDGRISVLLPHEVLAETYYVSYRIYDTLRLEGPEQRAANLVEWLYKNPNVSLTEPSLELAVAAGDIKRRFGLALTDSYVLAVAKMAGGKALFRKREAEMEQKLDELVREYSLVFLGA
jgi:predicted nucleic acid-binding protein